MKSTRCSARFPWGIFLQLNLLQDDVLEILGTALCRLTVQMGTSSKESARRVTSSCSAVGTAISNLCHGTGAECGPGSLCRRVLLLCSSMLTAANRVAPTSPASAVMPPTRPALVSRPEAVPGGWLLAAVMLSAMMLSAAS